MRSTLFALTLACLVALPVAVSAQECAELTVYIGDVTADTGETTYVPVKVYEDMIELNVEAFQFDFHYCLEYLDYTGFSTVGTMIEGLEDPVVYENPDGVVNIAWAGTTDLVGPGVFLYLIFSVNPDVYCWDYCTLWLTDFLVNELFLCEWMPPGIGFWHAGPMTEVEICVQYWSEDRPIPGAHVDLWSDDGYCDNYQHLEHTDVTGCTMFMVCSDCGYCFDITKEDYECDDGLAITSFDASAILAYVVGDPNHPFMPFNSWQEIAADVTMNGEITAFDAACILKWVLWCDYPDAIEMPEECNIGVWLFFCDSSPTDPVPCCFYIGGQPVFVWNTGVLVGDVTGNWERAGDRDEAIPVTISVPVVRGQRNPEEPIVVPVNGHGDLEVYSGTMTFGYDDSHVRLLDVRPVGLPAAMWLWAEGDDQVTVTFAGVEPYELRGCLLELLFVWRSGEETMVPVEVLSVAFNEDELETDLHDGAVRFPTEIRNDDAMDADPREVAGVALFAAPNPVPASASTTISFALDAAQSVELAIYDIGGRIVSRLAMGEYAAGVHSVTWNGRSDDGSALAAGVYFARLRTADARHQQRILMLR
jgi:hypothetical protein